MQVTHVDERKVLGHFEAKTKKSAELFRRAAQATPGGVMAGIKYFEPYPVFMARAEGSHAWDVDKNEYIDYLMSYGALILGHGAPEVRRAIESVLDTRGTTVFGTPTEAEVEYGETLRDIYHPGGMMRFTNSGLEATLLAVRLAKAFTRRSRVAKFEGHYHGAVDRLLFSYAPAVEGAGEPESPIPIADSSDFDTEMLRESLVLPFNDWESTERSVSRHATELACVIMEPFEEGVIPGDPGFMRNLRKLTRDLKIPLIYDEVKTGFRVRIGGASEFYSIYPDLSCLGKIIGGGFPVGAVVGDAELLAQLDPRRPGGRVFHSGTFNGNPVSVTAGRATVEALRRRGRFDSLLARAAGLKRMMSSALSRKGVEFSMSGEGAMFNFYLAKGAVRNYRDVKESNLRLRRLVDLELLSRGVYLKPENRFCLSLAHSDDDVRTTSDAFAQSLDEVLPGR